MYFNRMFYSAVITLCISPMVCSAQVTPVETQATQTLVMEMEKMNPQVPQLQQAIAQGANVNARSTSGRQRGFPVLHLSVWKSWKAMTLLVDKRADVNIQDRNGDTAMAIAAQSGFVETVAFLLDKGANPNIRNVNGRSVLGKALYTLTRSGTSQGTKRQVQMVVDLLKSKGAKE